MVLVVESQRVVMIAGSFNAELDVVLGGRYALKAIGVFWKTRWTILGRQGLNT